MRTCQKCGKLHLSIPPTVDVKKDAWKCGCGEWVYSSVPAGANASRTYTDGPIYNGNRQFELDQN